jgi:GalNAc5-diNAcBac-PP-undecaprenol beta-1,3-glucosyltransferase
MSLAATVIVPTHDHGPTLRVSLRTALAQTVEDLEVFVIGDGVPDVTREIVTELSRADERVRFFDHAKGPRHGEIYRDEALQEAAGEIVCYLSDDDLWFPEHVETMRGLLADADLAAGLPVRLKADGRIVTWPTDIALRPAQERMLAGGNYVTLSNAAHTLAAYRRLPQGWSTTPAGTATDLFMWQKFLRLPGVRLRSGTRPTALHFPTPHRSDWTLDERVAELEAWATKTSDPSWRKDFLGDVLDEITRRGAEIDAALLAAYASRTWRFKERLLRVPVLGTAARALAARGAPRATEQ